METIYDLIIIGSGPAGMSASIYASRAMLNFILLERSLPGGAIASSFEVENYPGIRKATGLELATMMIEHALDLGVIIKTEEVMQLDLSSEIKRVITSKTTYLTKTVILSTGASSRSLGVPGEEKYYGRGISYCATCDGFLYKGKTVVVVGGGDVAVEDAIYLSRFSKKVFLIHRRDKLRAAKVLQDKLFKIPNVEVIWDSIVTEIGGDDYVEFVSLENIISNQTSKVQAEGVFLAVGINPNSELVKGLVTLDEIGWVVTDEDCETSVKGVFAVGDVRKKKLRQVVTGAADGAIAVYAAEKYV